jgi:hypothetical protein
MMPKLLQRLPNELLANRCCVLAIVRVFVILTSIVCTHTQTLRNFERRGELAAALRVALQLELSSKALALVRRLLDDGLDTGAGALDTPAAIAASPLAACIAALDDDLLSRLLLLVRDWHATRVTILTCRRRRRRRRRRRCQLKRLLTVVLARSLARFCFSARQPPAFAFSIAF